MALSQGELSTSSYEYSGKTMLVRTLSAPDPIAAPIPYDLSLCIGSSGK